jgi:DNA topoisomerase II
MDSSNLSNKYQQKTDKQHILDNPDTYIGSVEKIDANVWILNEDNTKIVEKNITYIPGLFKLFDEGIVNCRDHVIRMQQASNSNVENALPVSYIDVTIVEADGTIIMTNDGNGIDVAEHPEYKIWIPELIFGHLRTSTNYDKNEKKIVGGKNGFGFKLALIWSTHGSIETVDHVRGLKYFQEFNNNLNEICKPHITKCSGKKPYTKISFRPDYARFGMPEGLSPDIVSLLKKRVYDVAAVTDKTLKVKYNSQLVPVKNFVQYIDLYIGNKDEVKRVYEDNGERWEYAVALSSSHEFAHVSFVNGIHTSKGGKHVEYILNQITRKLVEYIEKKRKVKVNPNNIKEQLILFLRCDIENPAFDSQTKDYMNTPFSKFGSLCVVSDKFIEKLAKIGVMDAACALTEVKENKAAKKTDGAKTKNIRGIPKLIDANWAGTERSSECTIIFCEGDSAKAGIVSGLSSEDRNTYGVYPMKGKILNVRGENIKKVSENKEIAEIKKILGLETGREYTGTNDLRYGRVLIMTDADLDGHHIKGLCINLFHTQWSALLHIPGFIGFMNTPILKATKCNRTMVFYNEGEYNEWKGTANMNQWKIKYYKGLGTSTGKEFREYFQQKKIVGFQHTGKESDDTIDLIFNKKRAGDRKDWLEKYNRDSYLNTDNITVSYEEFINKEFIHFSKYDCDRSIPNLMDGLKISLRKILYSAFKKNLTTEIKVAQFSGYVSEHSGYHHGEASLNAAIIGMAQNFIGSNNINLLMPNGQFGTRRTGQDHASERYIYTQLNKITRSIFPKEDDAILKYLDDDGLIVEPIFYAPIVPMILINGSKGIGTGFSTDIMCYNPIQIIDYLKDKLDQEIAMELEIEMEMNSEGKTTELIPSPTPIQKNTMEFLPYYEGFQGTIAKIATGKFLFKGKYTKIATDKIHITELPVGFWTEDFKEHLETLTDTADKTGKKIVPVVKDYNDMSKDTNIDFTITLSKGKLEELETTECDHGCNGLEKTFKLYSTSSNTNMHLFDAHDTLKKYDDVEEIIDDYYEVRLALYKKRKEYMIAALEQELIVLKNKTNYIRENLEETIDLRKKKKEEVIEMLLNKGYAIVDEDNEYKYLTKMPMDSVTEENAEKLFREYSIKCAELETIRNKTIMEMWSGELDVLRQEYIVYKRERNSGTSNLKEGGTEIKKQEKTKTKPIKKMKI